MDSPQKKIALRLSSQVMKPKTSLEESEKSVAHKINCKKPDYMNPNAPLDAKTDVHSFGCTWWKLSTNLISPRLTTKEFP